MGSKVEWKFGLLAEDWYPETKWIWSWWSESKQAATWGLPQSLRRSWKSWEHKVPRWYSRKNVPVDTVSVSSARSRENLISEIRCHFFWKRCRGFSTFQNFWFMIGIKVIADYPLHSCLYCINAAFSFFSSSEAFSWKRLCTYGQVLSNCNRQVSSLWIQAMF